jgi:hypothetical protein
MSEGAGFALGALAQVNSVNPFDAFGCGLGVGRGRGLPDEFPDAGYSLFAHGIAQIAIVQDTGETKLSLKTVPWIASEGVLGFDDALEQQGVAGHLVFQDYGSAVTRRRMKRFNTSSDEILSRTFNKVGVFTRTVTF